MTPRCAYHAQDLAGVVLVDDGQAVESGAIEATEALEDIGILLDGQPLIALREADEVSDSVERCRRILSQL